MLKNSGKKHHLSASGICSFDIENEPGLLSGERMTSETGYFNDTLNRTVQFILIELL